MRVSASGKLLLPQGKEEESIVLLMAAIIGPTMSTVSVQVTISLSFLKMFIKQIVGAQSSRGGTDTMDF